MECQVRRLFCKAVAPQWSQSEAGVAIESIQGCETDSLRTTRPTRLHRHSYQPLKNGRLGYQTTSLPLWGSLATAIFIHAADGESIAGSLSCSTGFLAVPQCPSLFSAPAYTMLFLDPTKQPHQALWLSKPSQTAQQAIVNGRSPPGACQVDQRPLAYIGQDFEVPPNFDHSTVRAVACEPSTWLRRTQMPEHSKSRD